MKKLIVVILVVMVLVIAGCGANSTQTEETTPSENIPDEKAQETHTDSGIYAGQIDSNFIEIKISGVPEEKAIRAFQLSEEVKNRFDEYGLETGDEIRFTYIPQEGKNDMIMSIEKIKN